MTSAPQNWSDLGFAQAPFFKISDDDGLLVYRCWGLRSPGMGSSEWGTGFFAAEKPTSVQDAELRLNIVDWGNAVRFVSTFRLLAGFGYWTGPVLHGAGDLQRPASQIYVEQPIQVKLRLVTSRELLRHDVFVSSVDGRA